MRGGAVCLPSKRFVGRGCQTRPALTCHKYSVYGLQQADAAPIKANSGSNAAPGAYLMLTFQKDYLDCAADIFC